jgi:hypothetical protein
MRARRRRPTSSSARGGRARLANAVLYLAAAPIERRLRRLQGGDARARRPAPSPPEAYPERADPPHARGRVRAGYEYDHNSPHGFSGQNYFPDAMERQPSTSHWAGVRETLRARLEQWAALRGRAGRGTVMHHLSGRDARCHAPSALHPGRACPSPLEERAVCAAGQEGGSGAKPRCWIMACLPPARVGERSLPCPSVPSGDSSPPPCAAGHPLPRGERHGARSGSVALPWISVPR